jgi:chorismate mutase
MATETSLKDLRDKISEVTLEIFRLCAKRFQLAKKVAEIKALENKPIKNLKIEKELREEVLNMCQKCGMDKGFCIDLLELLLDESKRVQRETLKS